MEKLAQKQEEWEYFSKFKEDNSSLSPEEFETKLIENGFDDLEDFKKYMGSLERSLKRANQGGEDDHEEEEIDPSSAWPLVDIPDDQLTAEQIKEKRKQKLHKANFEARERNKEIKRQEEEARLQFEKSNRNGVIVIWMTGVQPSV